MFNIQQLLHYKSEHYQKRLGATLFIEGFPIVPKAQLEEPWFGRFQCDKQNKQTTFFNVSLVIQQVQL